MGLFDKMRGHFGRLRERHTKTSLMERVTGMVEVPGAAGLWGYLNHRYGDGEIMLLSGKDGSAGLAADGTAYVGLHFLDFMGWLPHGLSRHTQNVANGSGAAFAYRAGAEMGDKAKASAPATHTAGTWEPPMLPSGVDPFVAAWSDPALAHYAP